MKLTEIEDIEKLHINSYAFNVPLHLVDDLSRYYFKQISDVPYLVSFYPYNDVSTEIIKFLLLCMEYTYPKGIRLYNDKFKYFNEFRNARVKQCLSVTIIQNKGIYVPTSSFVCRFDNKGQRYLVHISLVDNEEIILEMIEQQIILLKEKYNIDLGENYGKK